MYNLDASVDERILFELFSNGKRGEIGRGGVWEGESKILNWIRKCG